MQKSASPLLKSLAATLAGLNVTAAHAVALLSAPTNTPAAQSIVQPAHDLTVSACYFRKPNDPTGRGLTMEIDFANAAHKQLLTNDLNLLKLKEASRRDLFEVARGPSYTLRHTLDFLKETTGDPDSVTINIVQNPHPCVREREVAIVRFPLEVCQINSKSNAYRINLSLTLLVRGFMADKELAERTTPHLETLRAILARTLVSSATIAFGDSNALPSEADQEIFRLDFANRISSDTTSLLKKAFAGADVRFEMQGRLQLGCSQDTSPENDTTKTSLLAPSWQMARRPG